MPLVSGKVVAAAETAESAATEGEGETSDIAPALPQLTQLLAKLAREGEAGGTGMERTGRAGMQPHGKAEAHQQLVGLMALAREMVAAANADTPDQPVEPAADLDLLPQVAQNSHNHNIFARKPVSVKPLSLDAGVDAETTEDGTTAGKRSDCAAICAAVEG